MTVNNVNAVADGLKYVNGLEVCPEQTSIVQDVKGSIFNPVTLIFGGVEATNAVKLATDSKKLKDIPKNWGKLKDIKAVKPSEAFSTANIKDALKSQYDDIAKMASEKAAKKAAEEGTKKGIFSSIKSGFKKLTSGIGTWFKGTSIGGKITSKISSSPLCGKIGKLFKGTGAVGIMAFEGIIGVFTDIIPAFKAGGVKSGLKQTGKTALNVAGSGAGWAAGSWIGGAIGGVVGSIFPGAGNVIGAAVGKFLGGMVGSIIGGGLAKKVTGKSEVEKIQEQEVQKQAQTVAQDPTAMNELNALVAQQVQTDIANGNVTKDTEKMAEYLNSGSYNVSFQGNGQMGYTTPTISTNPSYWNQVAQQAQSGNTSIYNISNEKLDSLFKQPGQVTTNPVVQQQEPINYYAMA